MSAGIAHAWQKRAKDTLPLLTSIVAQIWTFGDTSFVCSGSGSVSASAQFRQRAWPNQQQSAQANSSRLRWNEGRTIKYLCERGINATHQVAKKACWGTCQGSLAALSRKMRHSMLLPCSSSSMHDHCPLCNKRQASSRIFFLDLEHTSYLQGLQACPWRRQWSIMQMSIY